MAARPHGLGTVADCILADIPPDVVRVPISLSMCVCFVSADSSLRLTGSSFRFWANLSILGTANRKIVSCTRCAPTAVITWRFLAVESWA